MLCILLTVFHVSNSMVLKEEKNPQLFGILFYFIFFKCILN